MMLLIAYSAAAVALLTPLVKAAAVSRRATITDFTTSPIYFDFPPAREGFSAATATQAACGGSAPGARTSFPLTGGDVALTSSTSLTGVNILWDDEANPSKFHGFHTYTNTLNALGAGHFCTKGPDFGALGKKAGDDATLLMIYQLEGTKTTYYQCADITLVDSSGFTPSDTYVCGNYTSKLEVASTDQSLKMAGTAASTSGGSDPHAEGTISTAGVATTASSALSRLSAAAGGGIGAGVAVAVFLLLGGLAYALGWIRVGKKKVELRDDTSSVSSQGVMKEAVRA